MRLQRIFLAKYESTKVQLHVYNVVQYVYVY